MIRRSDLVGAVVVAATYLLVLPEWSAGDFLVATLVAVGVVWLARSGASEHPGRRILESLRASAPLRIPGLAARVVADSTRGTWNVMRVVLGLGDPPCPGLVEVPMQGRSELEDAVLGLIVTMPPGSILVRIDPERHTLLFHVAGSTEEDFRRGVESLSERHLRRILTPGGEGGAR